MKMVSQLTRQAMSRHRLLTSQSSLLPISTPAEPVLPVSPSIVPPIPPTPEPPVKIPQPSPPQPPSASTPAMPSRSAPPAPRPRTIYQQLMKSHDRMTQRHL